MTILVRDHIAWARKHMNLKVAGLQKRYQLRLVMRTWYAILLALWLTGIICTGFLAWFLSGDIGGVMRWLIGFPVESFTWFRGDYRDGILLFGFFWMPVFAAPFGLVQRVSKE